MIENSLMIGNPDTTICILLTLHVYCISDIIEKEIMIKSSKITDNIVGYSLETSSKYWHPNPQNCRINADALTKIRDFSQLMICRPPSQGWSYLHERCAHWWIEWRINFPIFIFLVIADCIHNLRLIHLDFQVCYWPKKIVNQKLPNL